ncbi:two-component system OmpR family response regulator [Rhizobium sp. SG_E_25_P2]|jgi:two-component system, OmpR family, response regulator|uniref:response regulator transcription factor n=1 Tax=Rhizobium sp. SG_E_25_P2 TaxID=2879942 RepID=UPI00247383DE|nr:response regulator transcription factor [Rhizobium sp. SG_E_25_P2]MDH6266728.1 two-component system OmpR family response regulator [Rhizobium sp. SG_E_25_P2]
MAKVIIVEDDIELRESLIDYLTQCGHDLQGAGSAIEFYQTLSREEFDVVILDVNLPHYDGLSVAAHLSESSDAAIIVMTVQGAIADRVRGYKAGADLYMVKPVDCEELAAAVVALSKKRRKSDRAPEPGGGVWRLHLSEFQLTAPSGRCVDLTRNEVRVMELVSAQAGAIVSRGDLMQFISKGSIDPDSRALDAAISRLRSKVQAECQATLPLQTVQNAGFVFAGDIRMV